MPGNLDRDWEIRLAAFSALEQLTLRHGPILSYARLKEGFTFNGERIFFFSRAQGIFKPAQMTSALSVMKIPPPRAGRSRRYADDGETVTLFDVSSDEPFAYDFQEGRSGRNEPLLEAHRTDAPIVFFYGIQEGLYRPLWPAFIDHVDFGQRRFFIDVQQNAQLVVPGRSAADPAALQIERRYATVLAKRRLHQDLFRHRVLVAYDERCAICRLPRRELIEAAHILPDKDERGRPEVPNGLALCQLHHGAYDADLLGIDPDGVIEISEALLAERDGPTLEHAIKGFRHKQIHLPRHQADRPNPDYLALRFDQFKKAS